jgi:cell division protease FtsH
MERKTQFSIWYFDCALLAVLLLHNAWVGARSTAPIPYSEFQTLIKDIAAAAVGISILVWFVVLIVEASRFLQGVTPS